MRIALLIVSLTVLAGDCTARDLDASDAQSTDVNQCSDSIQIIQVHPVIEGMFYNLPLHKTRLDLREEIIKDKRFILTDTTFNDYPANTFFKGISADKGLIKSEPDSIQVLLAYGNAVLVTEKGGQEDTTRHLMFLEYKYFFSYKDSVELEYRSLLNLVYPIYTDTSSIKDDRWEVESSKRKEKSFGKIFDHFDPYYRVAIACISVASFDRTKPVFVLDIVFSKEDK